jgi:hypothetical protein
VLVEIDRFTPNKENNYPPLNTASTSPALSSAVFINHQPTNKL